MISEADRKYQEGFIHGVRAAAAMIRSEWDDYGDEIARYLHEQADDMQDLHDGLHS